MTLREYYILREYYEFCEQSQEIDQTIYITNINKKPKEDKIPKKPRIINQFNNIQDSQINNNINLEEDTQIKKEISEIQLNKSKDEKNQINIDYNNEKTKETTYKEKKAKSQFLRISTKKSKIPYGKWLDYYQKAEKKILIIKNTFLKNHPQILQDIISFFSSDPPKFLSHRIIEIKMAVADYGQLIINESIKDDEQILYHISYKKFCCRLQKKFIDENYEKNLGVLYVKYQEKNKGLLKDNNKKVVDYIRNNLLKEKEANELLDLSYYKLNDLFAQFYLEEYLKKKEEELVSIYETKIAKPQYTTIIKAFLNIVETLCKEFREYSESIKGRKVDDVVRKKKKFSLRHPKKQTKNRKGKK